LWVFIALAVLILFIIMVLCIPLDFIFAANINESPSYRMRLLWCFGLVSRDLKKTTGKATNGKGNVKVRVNRRRISVHTIIQILKTEGLFPQLWRLIADVYRSLKIKCLVINLKLGMENPADTAFIFALAGPVNYILNTLPYDIKIQPIFDGDFFLDANIRSITRLWPILIILALLKFIFSLSMIRIAMTLVMTRWKKA
jgi:hypothetical protein